MNALLCFSDMVQMLDKTATLEILQTIQRCTAVDHSAPTLMCTLGVANSIMKQVCDITSVLGNSIIDVLFATFTISIFVPARS